MVNSLRSFLVQILVPPAHFHGSAVDHWESVRGRAVVPRDKNQEPWLYWLGEKCILESSWDHRGAMDMGEKWEWVQMLNFWDLSHEKWNRERGKAYGSASGRWMRGWMNGGGGSGQSLGRCVCVNSWRYIHVMWDLGWSWRAGHWLPGGNSFKEGCEWQIRGGCSGIPSPPSHPTSCT